MEQPVSIGLISAFLSVSIGGYLVCSPSGPKEETLYVVILIVWVLLHLFGFLLFAAEPGNRTDDPVTSQKQYAIVVVTTAFCSVYPLILGIRNLRNWIEDLNNLPPE